MPSFRGSRFGSFESLSIVPAPSAQDTPVAAHRSRVADGPLPAPPKLIGAPRSSLRSRLWASERENFPLTPNE